MKKYKVVTAGLFLAGLIATGITWAAGQSNGEKNAQWRKPLNESITLRFGEKAYSVDLYDNPTTHDLLKKLPLNVQATDYPGYDEKVLRLATPLSMENAPRGDEPEIPEVGYYAPGQWIAVYFGPIGYWSGKVPLGRIHASVDEISAIPENTPVTIEKAK